MRSLDEALEYRRLTQRSNGSRNVAFDNYVLEVERLIGAVYLYLLPISLAPLHRPFDLGVTSYDAAQTYLFDRGYAPLP